MNSNSSNIISFNEIALICLALMLLSVTPAKTITQTVNEQQPVKLIVPVEQSKDVILKSA